MHVPFYVHFNWKDAKERSHADRLQAHRPLSLYDRRFRPHELLEAASIHFPWSLYPRALCRSRDYSSTPRDAGIGRVWLLHQRQIRSGLDRKLHFRTVHRFSIPRRSYWAHSLLSFDWFIQLLDSPRNIWGVSDRFCHRLLYNMRNVRHVCSLTNAARPWREAD